MSFYVIRGTFHVVGYSPDGDSIRFRANKQSNWKKLAGSAVKLNARQHAQLRLEAIDTLETHFQGTHQPRGLAEKALDFLLQFLNITNAEWDVLRTKIVRADDGKEGYIISRTVESNNRPVAFAFAGVPPEEDGAEVFLSPERLRQSLNYESVRTGLAYPTYYKGLFPDLRETITEAAVFARRNNLEIWAEDKTTNGFEVKNLRSISEDHVILPKLFRRLAEYLEAGGSVKRFREFLAQRAEGVTIISTAHFTHFDTVVEVNGNVVKMTEPPENLFFEG